MEVKIEYVYKPTRCTKFKELLLCSTQEPAIFKNGGEYQGALGATQRKYKNTSFHVT
jgi:hypothetical protein